jgi:hypothetical protein
MLTRIRALCNRNKLRSLRGPALGHSGIQDNEDADVLARKGWTSPFLGPKLPVPVSPYVARLKIEEWPIEKHSEYWADRLCMSYSLKGFRKNSVEGPAGGGQEIVLTGHCTLRRHLR